jgi:NAD(P)-dependent dehydrogenase (short-subunit alcohol dehydrogenase family)
MNSFPVGDLAVVVGATGGIGGALERSLQSNAAFASTLGFSRSSNPAVGLRAEESIAACAEHVARLGTPRLVIVATGVLHDAAVRPEKSWRELDAEQIAEVFAVNTIGPALLMKHFLPLLPRRGKAVFAALSARVGSIADNRLGGWYSYRASKAALNQLVRTAAVELRRRHPEAICVALHPGTVATPLAAPFAKTGLELQTPELAAQRLLAVIDGLTPCQSGRCFDNRGVEVPW